MPTSEGEARPHVQRLRSLGAGPSASYQGFGATLGIGFALGSPSRYFAADLPDPEYDDGIVGLSGFVMPRVFPVLYKYYDDNPLGSVIVTNWGEEPITDLSITMFVSRFMDLPRPADCPAPESWSRAPAGAVR